MHKILATGLAALAALCSYSGFAAETIAVKPGIGHTYHLDKKTGEASLHNLAENSAAEDFWIYNNGTFLDIGTDEELRKVVVDLDAMLSFAKSQLKSSQDRSFTIYHIHPLNADEEPESAPPGALDLYLHAIAKKEFRKMNANLTSCVFDGFGVWEYDISTKLENKLTASKSGTKSWRTFILQLDAKDDLLRNKSILNNIQGTQGIEKYIIGMKNLGVLLRYTPLNQQ